MIAGTKIIFKGGGLGHCLPPIGSIPARVYSFIFSLSILLYSNYFYNNLIIITIYKSLTLMQFWSSYFEKFELLIPLFSKPIFWSPILKNLNF
jgi:hypothetical protein